MRAWGNQAIDALERHFMHNEKYTSLGTDDMADFWQGMTEACVLRLVKLKPEMVKHYGGEYLGDDPD